MFELLLNCGRNYRVFLLGSTPELIERAVVNLGRRFPDVKVVGYHHGYFTLTEEPLVVDCIHRSRPDILFIGMSSPLKEYFVERNCEALGVPVQLGVGGTLDCLAGVFSLPPQWIRQLGLEWLYHLCQEPRRLWKRYLVSTIIFAWFLAEHFSLRIRGHLFERDSN
jgi:N-acetylglucosaminyldiphosphoundecaprenol N-acetyl-beta-D-mannosaminyltransferase